jgi:hypothetical protein
MYHIKVHSVQMTSLQSQYLLWPPLACNTARTHQQPKNATSGYFTWENGPWQQEKQHQLSHVSDEYRHRQSDTVFVKNGLRAWRPCFGAVLIRRHRFPRIRWCNRVRGWDLQNWRRVWFSDESRFMLQKRDGRTRVYRRRNERIARNCVLQVDNFIGGSVMMWGAISYARKTQPCNLSAARYRDEVLTPHILPAMNLRREICQHDNARPHTARATVDFLANQNVRVLTGRLNHQIWTQ